MPIANRMLEWRQPAATALVQGIRVRDLLPRGNLLRPSAHRGRHLALVVVLWLHVPALFVLALAQHETLPHSVLEAALVATLAAGASLATARQSSRVAPLLVTLGLVTASAMLVHITGGTIEAHFHFFVVVTLLLLYEDWLVLGVACGYVLLHHGLLGMFFPSSVYNHADALAHPWKWAVIHGGFVLAVAVASVANWRLNEGIRREMDEARRESAALAAIVESSEDAIVGLGLDGRIETWNPAAEKLYGYTREEVLGRTPAFLAPPDSAGEASDMLARVLRGEAIDQWETTRLHKNGATIEIALTTFPIVNGDGERVGMGGLTRDIREKKALQTQLQQSQRLEAVGMLAGGIAHDFNNLITAIQGYADLVLTDLPAEAPSRCDVQEIKRAAERAASLTAQLLAFSRRQVLEPRVLDLNAVVQELDALVRRVIGEHVDVQTAVAPQLGLVEADPAKIEQVVLNLVVNARDAMPDGGTITIETRNVSLSGEIDGIAIRPDDYVLLRVADTGSGMDAEVLARVFEPFFTTKGVGRGTGLGLSTVYGIVKQSGGYVFARSRPGEGSSFDVYLPRVCGPVPRPAARPAPSGDIRGEETILLVEDEAVVRNLAAEGLSRSGFTVLSATDADAALAVVREHPGDIDLLLTDIVMPGLSGVELAGRVAALRSEVATLFMSGYPAHSPGAPVSIPPHAAFLQKPFTLAALNEKVREAIDARPAAAAAASTGGSLPGQRDREPLPLQLD